MSTPDPAQVRTRAAHHEAAHVAAGYALGLEISGPATIVQADGFTGNCFIGTTLRVDGNGQRPPTPMLYRAEVTSLVLIYLAGQHGAWQASEVPAAPLDGAALGTYERKLEASARRIAEFTATDDPRPQDDYHRAQDLLIAYFGPDQPGLAYMELEVLDAEAGHLVAKLRRPITLLARELLAHDHLEADRLVELCRRNVATPLLSQRQTERA